MQENSVNINNLLKRVSIFLEDEEWDKAIEYCEKILDLDPENSQAYLGRLLATCKATSIENLAYCEFPFDNNNDYKKILRYGDDSLKLILENHLQTIKITNTIIAFQQEETKKRKLQEIEEYRNKIKPFQSLVACGDDGIMAVKLDGTVFYTPPYDAERDEMRTYYFKPAKYWTEIKTVACGYNWAFAVRNDGDAERIVADSSSWLNEGQFWSDKWYDLCSIKCGSRHTVALKTDGTVIAVGENSKKQCNTSTWTNVVSINARIDSTIAVRSDGKVYYAGYSHSDADKVTNWSDIVSAVTTGDYSVGLKKDGSVVATGYNADKISAISNWENIVAIETGNVHVVGLKMDGTVVAIGDNDEGQCDVSSWKNIVAVFCGRYFTVGLKSDGHLVYTGKYDISNGDITTWRLFDSADTYEEEFTKQQEIINREKERLRIEAEKKKQLDEERERRRNANLCQHCGSEFKGLFFKKCSSCGIKKDY